MLAASLLAARGHPGHGEHSATGCNSVGATPGGSCQQQRSSWERRGSHSGRWGAAAHGTRVTTGAALGRPGKPHIALFLFDDLGFNDIGDFAAAEGGQEHCVAPVMQGLMQTGIKLKQFYAQPICSPTRAALMTGRYPIRYGGQTGTAEGVRTWIPDGEPMLPERLSAIGYSCHAVGKWRKSQHLTATFTVRCGRLNESRTVVS